MCIPQEHHYISRFISSTIGFFLKLHLHSPKYYLKLDDLSFGCNEVKACWFNLIQGKQDKQNFMNLQSKKKRSMNKIVLRLNPINKIGSNFLYQTHASLFAFFPFFFSFLFFFLFNIQLVFNFFSFFMGYILQKELFCICYAFNQL